MNAAEEASNGNKVKICRQNKSMLLNGTQVPKAQPIVATPPLPPAPPQPEDPAAITKQCQVCFEEYPAVPPLGCPASILRTCSKCIWVFKQPRELHQKKTRPSSKRTLKHQLYNSKQIDQRKQESS
eukprot:CAMPEP_0197858192 /NCGR_PEP_ID=MMETSP1438-20131217/31815_1 /TAXON_ID=1461541 /ORGANISM="Pterosperma sp., Strain CCMP1384" /LENGTH=125 /DNA_ID=CAMNT_0043474273 /DNA_START=12 /DNA_END=385 /DNA_ORIENTATION=+